MTYVKKFAEIKDEETGEVLMQMFGDCLLAQGLEQSLSCLESA